MVNFRFKDWNLFIKSLEDIGLWKLLKLGVGIGIGIPSWQWPWRSLIDIPSLERRVREDGYDDEDVSDDGEDDDGAEAEHRRQGRPLGHRQVGPQQLRVVQPVWDEGGAAVGATAIRCLQGSRNPLSHLTRTRPSTICPQVFAPCGNDGMYYSIKMWTC